MSSSRSAATNLGAYDHGQCAGLAIFGGTLWIQNQVEECATSVHESGLDEFTAFPNPASDVVTLHGLTPAATWSVRSMTGAVAKQGQGSRLDVQDLPAGMWLVVADGFAPQVLSVTH